MNPSLMIYHALEDSLRSAQEQLRVLREPQTKLLHELCREALEKRCEGWWDGSWHHFNPELSEQFFHTREELFGVTFNLFRRRDDECISVEFSFPAELALPQDDFDVERLRAHFLAHPEDIYVE